MGYVRRASIARNPAFGTIRHRILFGVDGSLFMTFANNR